MTDSDGSPVGFEYNGSDYFYVKNLQGDIMGILDNTYALVAEYSYDEWGKVISVTGINTALGNLNPLRYRSYYYDSETGLYYLQSRYYDPEIGRFINADDVNFIGIDDTYISYNAFAYCNNNPANDSDPSGHLSIKTITNYIKSLGNRAYSIAKKLINSFIWKPNNIGLKLFEVLIDSLINFLPFSYAFKFVGYKAVTKQLVKAAFQNSKKGIMTFLTKIGVTISFNTLFSKIVNGVIFKYASRLLTVGGIVCLVLDSVDGKVDYWFEYGRYK